MMALKRINDRNQEATAAFTATVINMFTINICIDGKRFF